MQNVTRYVLSPDNLARAVFLQNGRNGAIHLEYPTGPRTARDTFNFLLDLFLKGLVLLYGDANGRLEVDTLDAAQVEYATERMRFMGVHVSVITVAAPTTSMDTEEDALRDAADMLADAGLNLSNAIHRPSVSPERCVYPRFEDMEFTIRSRDRIIRIQFRCDARTD